METYEKHHKEAVRSLLSSIGREIDNPLNFTPWKIQELKVQDRWHSPGLFIHIRGPKSETGYFSIGMKVNVGNYTEMFNTVKINTRVQIQAHYKGDVVPLFEWGVHHPYQPIENIKSMLIDAFEHAEAFIAYNYPSIERDGEVILEYTGEKLKEVPENLKDLIEVQDLYTPIDYDYEAITRELLLDSIDGIYTYLESTPLKETEVRIDQTFLMVKGTLALPDGSVLGTDAQLDFAIGDRAVSVKVIVNQTQTCNACLQEHKTSNVLMNYIHSYSGRLDVSTVIEKVREMIDDTVKELLSKGSRKDLLVVL